jgi:hypothetical protein
MVWIHGGGYTLGWKTLYGSGAGLVAASQRDGKEGVIYVALNYRLGLFVRFLILLDVTDNFRVFFPVRPSKLMEQQMPGCWIKGWLSSGFRTISPNSAAIQTG